MAASWDAAQAEQNLARQNQEVSEEIWTAADPSFPFLSFYDLNSTSRGLSTRFADTHKESGHRTLPHENKVKSASRPPLLLGMMIGSNIRNVLTQVSQVCYNCSLHALCTKIPFSLETSVVADETPAARRSLLRWAWPEKELICTPASRELILSTRESAFR